MASTFNLVKGPFELKWGANLIKDVESVEIAYEQESNDYTTVDGRSITVKGAISASATITLLASDTETLSALLPQYAKEGTASTGEAIAEGKHIIDILAGDCDTDAIKNDLYIKSCGQNAEYLRINGCSTSLSNVSLENNQVRTVEITFTGEPDQGVAAIQMWTQGAIPVESN